jgi:general secretion pathway protein H
MRRARGTSLLELLVVIAIIAILTGVAVLAVSAVGAPRQLEREAERWALLIDAACERAQWTGRDIGIHLARARLGFSTVRGEAWVLETSGDLRPRELPGGFGARIWIDDLEREVGADLPESPQAACFASGELTAFEIELTVADVPPRRVRGAIDGRVELVAVQP